MLEIEDIISTANRARWEDRGAKNIPAMRRHQDWVKLHADTSLDVPSSMSFREFQRMVSSLLPEQKVEIFNSLLRFPLPTTALTSVIFDRLSRIFEGRNPVHNYQFQNTEFADDWEWYRQEVLDEPNVWRTKAWDYFKTEPNSILVIDMPVAPLDNGDRFVQPYFYWVTVDNLVDYKTNEKGEIEWIIYKNEERKRVYAVDDKYYRSFAYDGSTDAVTAEGMTENKHSLGYCPAAFFIDEPVSLSNPDIKKSPITDVLSELDWYLFFVTSEKHLNLYASYPIYSGYEATCGYEKETENTYEKCSHGFLFGRDGSPLYGADGKMKLCPVCGKHQVRGAGTFITVPAPDADNPNMIEAVKMLGVDRDSLDFNREKAKGLENAIINKCVGTEGNVFAEFSISEKQVDANYESQSTILVRVKKVFENAQWFVDDTVCRLRYGKNYISTQIDYGTEFYTLSTEQLRKRYQVAKDGGASQSDLLALRKQIIETEYRTNPLMLQRMLILADIEPLLGSSLAEAREMLKEGIVSEEDVMVKANFASLLARFERENANIIDFGGGLPYRSKIEKIKQTFYTYVKENIVRSDSRRVSGAIGE